MTEAFPGGPGAAGLLLGAALALAACGEAPRDAALTPYPSALAQWRGANGFIAAGYAAATLHFVDAEGRGGHAWAGRAGSTRPEQVLRIALDEPRRLLWVLGEDVLFAYRLPLGANPPLLIARLAVPFSRVHPKSCLPDLALDAQGAVYASSTHSPTIVVVRPERYRAQARLVRFEARGAPPWSLSALAFTPEGRYLLAADAATGTLWRVDRDSFEAQAVRGTGELYGACGLAWLGPRTLAIARGFEKGVSVLEISEDYLQVVAPARTCLDRAFAFSVLALDGEIGLAVPGAAGLELRRIACPPKPVVVHR